MKPPAGKIHGPLLLTGKDGLLRYDRMDLAPGQSVTVGRSRRCRFSLRRSRTFLTANEAEQRRILGDRDFLKVSRRHCRITYLPAGNVEVWDLSRNGTWVNGMKVDRLLLTEIPEAGVEIRLGEGETIALFPAHAHAASA